MRVITRTTPLPRGVTLTIKNISVPGHPWYEIEVEEMTGTDAGTFVVRHAKCGALCFAASLSEAINRSLEIDIEEA